MRDLTSWQLELGLPATSAQSLADPGQSSLLLSISRPAMACEFEVLQNQHQYPQGADAAVEVLDLVEEIERALSVYLSDSDFSRLNRSQGKPVSVGVEAMQVLQLAQCLHQATAGSFDITAGALSESWGFSRRQGRIPSDSEIEESLARVGSEQIELDEANSLAQLKRPGAQVNPGGIGKGYALDLAAARLRAAGISDFMLHGGLSSITACGNRKQPDGLGGWLVALKHPLQSERTLGRVRLRAQSLATSGSGKQFFHFQGRRYSHIIDPRSGRPAEGVWSATVVCPSAAIADALATAFFVMGVEQTQAFCEQHPDISAILVHPSRESGREAITCFNVPEAMWQENN